MYHSLSFVHTDGAVMFHSVTGSTFQNRILYVQWHNTQFTNTSCSILPLVCTIYISYIALHSTSCPPVSPPSIFPICAPLKFHENLPGWSTEGPLGVGFFSNGTELSPSLEPTLSIPVRSNIMYCCCFVRCSVLYCI
jgi:hypothetical protein